MYKDKIIGKYNRLVIVDKNGKPWVWLNDENLPAMKGDYLKNVKHTGRVENEHLYKEEISYCLHFS
jgi:hypothetical protein